MDKQTWSADLKSYIRQQRASCPIPDRETLSDEEEMHCRIIGGEFMSWYRMRLGGLLNQRQVLRVEQFDPEPIIVLTSSFPGLVAAQEIFEEDSEDPLYLLKEEFESWQGYSSDERFQWHIHHWSFIEPVSTELLAKAQSSYPDVAANTLRAHVIGDLWGRSCGIEATHLWRWDGEEMDLLEEAFTSSVF